MGRGFGVLSLVVLFACDEHTSGRGDAAADAPSEGAAPDGAPLVSPVASPSAPDFSGCPEGWRLGPHPSLATVEVCDPWPAIGRMACELHEGHFPGTAGCRRIGSPCPVDGWPAGLPVSEVVYLRADAASGGDGSRAAPYRDVAVAAAAVPDGGTLAIAVGVYDGTIVADRSMRVVGACPEEVVLLRSGAGTDGLPLINASRGAELEVRDLTLRSTKNDQLLAQFADVDVRDVVFDGAGLVQFGGSSVVRDVRVVGFGGAAVASALSITGVDRAVVERVVVEDGGVGGIALIGDDVSLSDAAVLSVEGIGIQLSGPVVSVARVIVDEVEEFGLTLGGEVVAEDLMIRGVRPTVATAAGLSSLADLTARRLRVEDAGDVALSVVERGASVEDLVLLGSDDPSRLGRGVEVGSGAVVRLSRTSIHSTDDLGVLATGEGTALTLDDVVVDDVESGAGVVFGRCLHAQLGASVDTTRTRFARCREAAVTASFDASVRMRDATVERILPLGCSVGDCPDARAGIGLVALEGDGAIDVERFVVSEAALAGVQVIEGGTIDLRDGTIRDSVVGINVQAEGYDLERLVEGVVFENNGINLDSAELPVPPATASPAAP